MKMQSASPSLAPELWRLKEVLRHVPLSKPSIYRMTATGEFPRQINLTEGTVVWLADEVRNWLRERVEAGKQAREARS